jgi:hypothetical protein
MPGNPKECREYALRCADLAHTARTPKLKELLIDLSKNWIKLAIELERSAALVEMESPRGLCRERRSKTRQPGTDLSVLLTSLGAGRNFSTHTPPRLARLRLSKDCRGLLGPVFS